MTTIAHGDRQLPPTDHREMPDPPPAAENGNGKPDLDAPETDAGDPVDLDNAVQPYTGINIGGDVVTKATAALPEDQRVLVRWLYDHARTHNWGWDRAAAESRVSRTVLYRVFKGVYTYPDSFPEVRKVNGLLTKVRVPHPKAGKSISLVNVCDKIEKLKATVEKAQTLFSIGFIETTIWKTIAKACERALLNHRPLFIYGESQIGKTECGKEFARTHNGGMTTYTRIPPTGGVQSLLKCFARALHVSAKKSFDSLLQDVLGGLDKSKLLIVDELHEIFVCYHPASRVRCMELIRYMWDETHCGMILMGSNIFRDAMHEGEFFMWLRQLRLRGLQEIQLPPGTSRTDLKLALASYGLDWPDEPDTEEELNHIAQDGFGQVLMRLKDGQGIAESAGHDYTWADFTKARDIIRKMSK